MGSKIKTSRVVAFGLVIALLIALCVGTLYQMQIINGAAYYETSQNEQTSPQAITAARGNILDRYGRVLVSNRECYNLLINTTKLFSDDVEDPNALILEMVNIVEENGIDWTDDLPISEEPPYEYDSNMSALHRSMLEAYFKRQGLDEDTSAVELMSYFRTRYEISNSYSSEDMRKISAIRYALNVRYAINTGEYIFVEDASIDLISELMGVVGSIIEVRSSYVREYATQYAAHLLGYVGPMTAEETELYMRGDDSGYSYNSQVGKDGAEYTFESWLHGSDGTARVTRDADGTITNTVYIEDPVPGNHVYLTIDIQLQEAAERALENGILSIQQKRDEDNVTAAANGEKPKEDVQGGAVVVVDVKTGNPLAMASYPTFDASQVFDNYSEYLEAEYDPLFNRATMGAYAPGSTFKPCTAIAALSENIINTETRIKCEGVFTKYADQGYTPHCWIYDSFDGLMHGSDNVADAVRDSCNYFFYSVADSLGIDALDKYAAQFGLGESTGIELPEVTGNMANPDNHEDYDVDAWVYGDTLQAGIGQSDSTFTPLQLAEYCAAIANGGTRHSASILKSVRSFDYTRQLYDGQPEVLSTVDSADYNFAAVQQGMYELAHDPNSSSAEVYQAFVNYSYNGEYIGVAAKTGTSQLGEEKTNNAIFMCYAPFDDPEIAVAIVVERGQSGANCTGIAKDILDAYFSLSDKGMNADSENALLR